MFEIKVYEKDRDYTSSLTLCVCSEDRLDLERILLENGYSIKVTQTEAPAQEDDF